MINPGQLREMFEEIRHINRLNVGDRPVLSAEGKITAEVYKRQNSMVGQVFQSSARTTVNLLSNWAPATVTQAINFGPQDANSVVKRIATIVDTFIKAVKAEEEQNHFEYFHHFQTILQLFSDLKEVLEKFNDPDNGGLATYKVTVRGRGDFTSISNKIDSLLPQVIQRLNSMKSTETMSNNSKSTPHPIASLPREIDKIEENYPVNRYGIFQRDPDDEIHIRKVLTLIISPLKANEIPKSTINYKKAEELNSDLVKKVLKESFDDDHVETIFNRYSINQYMKYGDLFAVIIGLVANFNLTYLKNLLTKKHKGIAFAQMIKKISLHVEKEVIEAYRYHGITAMEISNEIEELEKIGEERESKEKKEEIDHLLEREKKLLEGMRTLFSRNNDEERTCIIRKIQAIRLLKKNEELWNEKCKKKETGESCSHQIPKTKELLSPLPPNEIDEPLDKEKTEISINELIARKKELLNKLLNQLLKIPFEELTSYNSSEFELLFQEVVSVETALRLEKLKLFDIYDERLALYLLMSLRVIAHSGHHPLPDNPSYKEQLYGDFLLINYLGDIRLYNPNKSLFTKDDVPTYRLKESLAKSELFGKLYISALHRTKGHRYVDGLLVTGLSRDNQPTCFEVHNLYSDDKKMAYAIAAIPQPALSNCDDLAHVCFRNLYEGKPSGLYGHFTTATTPSLETYDIQRTIIPKLQAILQKIPSPKKLELLCSAQLEGAKDLQHFVAIFADHLSQLQTVNEKKSWENLAIDRVTIDSFDPSPINLIDNELFMEALYKLSIKFYNRRLWVKNEPYNAGKVCFLGHSRKSEPPRNLFNTAIKFIYQVNKERKQQLRDAYPDIIWSEHEPPKSLDPLFRDEDPYRESIERDKVEKFPNPLYVEYSSTTDPEMESLIPGETPSINSKDLPEKLLGVNFDYEIYNSELLQKACSSSHLE